MLFQKDFVINIQEKSQTIGSALMENTRRVCEVEMIAVVILIVLVTVLSVYSAFGTYQNQQDIKALTDVTKMIGVNAKHIYQILEMLKEQENQ